MAIHEAWTAGRAAPGHQDHGLVAFTTPPGTSPAIAAIRQQADDGVRELCRNALEALRELGLLHADRDRPLEITRMHALLDGLTVHLLLTPARLDAGLVSSVISIHLGELASAPLAV